MEATLIYTLILIAPDNSLGSDLFAIYLAMRPGTLLGYLVQSAELSFLLPRVRRGYSRPRLSLSQLVSQDQIL